MIEYPKMLFKDSKEDYKIAKSVSEHSMLIKKGYKTYEELTGFVRPKGTEGVGQNVVKQQYPKTLFRDGKEDTEIANGPKEHKMLAKKGYGTYEEVIMGIDPKAEEAEDEEETVTSGEVESDEEDTEAEADDAESDEDEESDDSDDDDTDDDDADDDEDEESDEDDDDGGVS